MRSSKKVGWLGRSVSVAALTVALMPAMAVAQEAPAEEEESSRRLTTVTVTAQKREESLQDVPVAVTAYTSETLEALGVNDALDIVNLTPGLGETTQSGSNKNYFLRGIGTTDFHLTAASAVGQYYDEVTLTSGFHARSALFDMERVEILKGPQNTLFGLNTTGGAINYISNKPEVGAGLNGNAKITVGSDAQFGVDGALGFDIGSQAAGRIAIHTNKNDGPFESVTNGKDYGDDDLTAYRAAFVWEPTDSTTLRFNIHGSDNENNGAVVKAQGTRAPDGSGDLCAEFNPAQVVDFDRNTNCFTRDGRDNGQPATDPSTADWEQTSQGYGFEDIETIGYYLKLDQDFGWATLNLMGAFDNLNVQASIDSDGSASTLLHLNQADDRDTKQYEARLVSNADQPFRWIGGIYYLDEEADSFTGVISPGIGRGANNPNVQLAHTKENLGVYAQGEYDITDAFTLTAGLRYSEEDIQANYLPSNPNALDVIDMPIFQSIINQLVFGQFAGTPGTDANGFATNRQVQRNLSNEDVGYTIKLDWKATDDSLIYASHSKGFKGGAADIRAAFALVPPARLLVDLDESQLEPESLLAWEIGYKGAFWDDRIQLDTAAFHYTYDNLQQFITAGGVPTLDNAEEAVVYGLDGNVKFANDSGFYLDLGVSLLDTEITDVGDSTRFLEGAELANSPSFSGSVTASQLFTFGNGSELTLTGNASHTGDAIKAVLLNATDRTGNIRTQEAFTLVNANATYRFGPDNQFSASVFGNNLTDEHFCGFRGVNEANRVFDDGIRPADLSHTVTCRTSRAATRTFGASFGVEF